MTQSNTTVQQEIIEYLTKEVLDSYLILATTVLLPIHEFIITLDQEVTVVWMRDNKLSLGSILLVSTRWCVVLTAIMVPFPTSTMTSCKIQLIASRFFLCAGFAQVAVFSALRVSAIWGRNWLLFLVVSVLGLVPVVPNAYVVATWTYSFDTGSCIATTRLSLRTIVILGLITRVSVIIADVLVLVLTWVKTYEQVVSARRLGQTMSVSICLLRDGTIYFVILLALNLFALLTVTTLTSKSVFDTPVVTIPPILVSRFILNLRQVDGNGGTRTDGRLPDFSAPQFEVADSVFGNFGEPLEHGVSLLREEMGGMNEVDEGLQVEGTAWDEDGGGQENRASKNIVE